MPLIPSSSSAFNRNAPRDEKGINAPVDGQDHALLHVAVEQGDVAAAERLLRLNANPNQPDGNGRSPLFAAVAAQNVEMVRLLVDHGAEFNTADSNGRTPLVWAVEQGASPAFFDQLRDLGADFSYVGPLGIGVVHAAASTGSESLLDYFIGQRLSLDVADRTGRTPLHVAAENGAVAAMGTLIAAGADPLLRTRDIKTPLHIAAALGDVAAVDLLLEIPEVRRSLNDFQTYSEGRTPLMAAVVADRIDVASRLIMCGANVNQRDNKNRHSLFLAVERGLADMAEMLIDNGADVVKAPRASDTGQSMMQSIGIARYEQVLTLLCRAGADIDERDDYGQTPLYKAASQKDPRKVRALLEQGASPDATNGAGRRPIDEAVLSYSSFGGDNTPDDMLKTVDALLVHGANPNMSPTGTVPSAPLHMAARLGRTDLIGLLLDHGALVDEPDRGTGVTPWLVAVGARNAAAADLLSRRGADVSKKDKTGRTVLHMAAQSGMREVIESALKNPSIRANIDAVDDTGSTALHIAMRYQRNESIIPLLQGGANPGLCDQSGLSPLHIAANTYSEALINVIDKALDGKVNWNVQNQTEKEAPLHMAARNGYRTIVERLLKSGADATLRDRRGYTPLMSAANGDQSGAVAALAAYMKQKGQSVDEARDNLGRSALHIAAARYSPLTAAALLDAGANPNVRTADGETPLMVATREGRIEVVRLLLRRGADPVLTNALGATAVDYAVQTSRTDIVDVINEEIRKRQPPPPPPMPSASFRRPAPKGRPSAP